MRIWNKDIWLIVNNITINVIQKFALFQKATLFNFYLGLVYLIYLRHARFQQSGAAEACWAHNPEVDGSKPSSATYAVIV